MSLPNTYTDINETGCCAIPNYEQWDNKTLNFDNQHFIRMHTRSFMYMPLNMGSVLKKLDKMAEEYDVRLPDEEAMILSKDLSSWKAEQLYGVSRPIEGADNVTLNGEFLSRVFEGPYKEAKNWYKQMGEYAQEKDKKILDLYFFYTTCPKCAKHYGKNYVIGLAKI